MTATAIPTVSIAGSTKSSTWSGSATVDRPASRSTHASTTSGNDGKHPGPQVRGLDPGHRACHGDAADEREEGAGHAERGAIGLATEVGAPDHEEREHRDRNEGAGD